ncbi:MAG: serine/threonine protein kinase [Lysobacteraceae bacterium]|nr:MAG: serine/threonine protein kinase [Xanthomonadaceae bacterium]
MRTEETAEDLRRLRIHLGLPRVLRSLHLRWLYRRDAAAHRLLREWLEAQPATGDSIIDGSMRDALAMAPDEQIAPADLISGDRLGPWRIHALLAQGGMGNIYLAHRDDGAYAQTVAIKRIRADKHTRFATDIFLREREILARLSYPGICRLIDGGMDGSGAPWLAMELIHGERIDDWSDRHRLTVRERVELFLQACDAVDYAHTQNVLHGDIKPGNLLVDQNRRVVLLDFGVSILVDKAERSASFAGATLAYSAPESMARSAAEATGDVFALGAVLCRLIAAAPPTDNAAAMMAGLFGHGRTSAFEAGALIAKADDTVLLARKLRNRRALARLVSGDLGAILDKCLRYDPRERYGSVADLGKDLRRWLRSQPVAAVGGGALYRIRKTLHRHRAVIAATACMLLLLCGSCVYVWQKHRIAQTNLTQINRILEETLGAATLPRHGRAALNPQSLLVLTETRLRAASREVDEETLAYGLLTVARSYNTIGDDSGALRLIVEARGHGRNNRYIRNEADAIRVAVLNRQARYQEAENIASAALRRPRWLPSAFASNHADTDLTMELARARWHQGKQAAASRLLDETIAANSASAKGVSVTLPELLILRAQWKTDLYETESSMRDLERAIRLSETTRPRTADNARLVMVRTLLRMNRQPEAYRLATETLASYEKTYGTEHPESGRALLACIEAALQKVTLHPQQVDVIRAHLHRAMRIFRDSFGTTHPLYTETMKYSAYLRALSADGDPVEIIDQARQSLVLLRKAPGATPAQLLSAKITLADILWEYSRAMDEDGWMRESIDLYAEVAAQTERDKTPIPHVLSVYAHALNDAGDGASAKKILHRANIETKTYLGEDNPLLIFNNLLIARIELAEGDDRAAEVTLERARGIAEANKIGAGKLAKLAMHQLKAQIHERRGDRDLARQELEAAIDYWIRINGNADDRRFRDIAESLARMR